MSIRAPDGGAVSDDELVVTLDLSDRAAINVAKSKSDVYMRARKLATDHQLRSRQRRKAEIQLFERARDRIQRLKRGWSPLSDGELTAGGTDERERARKARNKRDQRARKAKPSRPAPTRSSLAVTKEAITSRLACLETWLALPGHRQRHLRGRKSDIMRAWIVYQEYINQHRIEPTSIRFADAFAGRFKQPMTRQMAQKRLALLAILSSADGPLR